MAPYPSRASQPESDVTEDTSPETFLDQQVAEFLRPVSLGMGGLFAFFSVAHALILPPGPRTVMVLCASLSATVLLTLSEFWRRSPPDPIHSHKAMNSLTLIALLNTATHLYVTQAPEQTVNLLILQVGYSIVFLRHRWFIANAFILALVWLGLWATSSSSPLWPHYGFSLLSATVVSTVIHIAFHRQMLKVQRLHQANRRQKEGLEELAETAIANSRSKSRFIAHLSHEMRTPLNAIIGFSKLLERKAREQLDEKQRLYLERINNNGHHLLDVINQVLDLSSLEADRVTLTLSPVDLGELAHETLQGLHPLARDKGLDLCLEVPPNIKPLETDRNRLKQVLINLLGNAIKFTDQGAIVLRLQGERQTLRPLALVVTDTGSGIPQDRLESIFEPFEQLDPTSQDDGDGRKGSGLGLPICRLLCRRLGFHLEASSVVGEGSSFTVHLVDPETADAPVRFDPNLTGTIAIVLKPSTDGDGIEVQSAPPKEAP